MDLVWRGPHSDLGNHGRCGEVHAKTSQGPFFIFKKLTFLISSRDVVLMAVRCSKPQTGLPSYEATVNHKFVETTKNKNSTSDQHGEQMTAVRKSEDPREDPNTDPHLRNDPVPPFDKVIVTRLTRTSYWRWFYFVSRDPNIFQFGKTEWVERVHKSSHGKCWKNEQNFRERWCTSTKVLKHRLLCEDGCFPISRTCLTISNDDPLCSSETAVNPLE
jgi:hypothetical protein